MLLHTGEAAPRSAARLVTTVAARLGGRATYALEGSIFIAGAAVQWLCDGLGLQGGPRAAEALAQTARPDHGVVLVPAFTGLGAPYWDADARGALYGLTRDAGLAEIAEATFEASALQTRDLIEAMRKDAPAAFGQDGAGELRIDGGMAQSAWFGQKLADVTGLSVAPAVYAETTALGAALFAGIGAGIYPTAEAAASTSPHAGRLEPAASAEWRAEKYARWTDAVRRTRSDSSDDGDSGFER
jgi:glycerol kinase